mgnify:CR=1 FL=1
MDMDMQMHRNMDMDMDMDMVDTCGHMDMVDMDINTWT